jgi:hypothetical protein
LLLESYLTPEPKLAPTNNAYSQLSIMSDSHPQKKIHLSLTMKD